MSDGVSILPDSDNVTAQRDSDAIARHLQSAPSTEGKEEALDVKTLAQRLADTQAKLTEVMQQRAEDREALAEFRGRLATAEEVPEVEEPDPLDQSKWTEEEKAELADISPSTLKLLNKMRAADRKFVADTIELGITEQGKSLADTLTAEIDPARAQVQPVIDKLADKSWFKKLSRKEQISAAKDYMQEHQEQFVPPSTGPNLGRRMAQPRPEDERQKAIKNYVKSKFPDRPQSNRIYEPEAAQ